MPTGDLGLLCALCVLYGKHFPATKSAKTTKKSPAPAIPDCITTREQWPFAIALLREYEDSKEQSRAMAYVSEMNDLNQGLMDKTVIGMLIKASVTNWIAEEENKL